jgi:hypothetical protein
MGRPKKHLIFQTWVVKGGFQMPPNTTKVYASKYKRGENNYKECKYI